MTKIKKNISFRNILLSKNDDVKICDFSLSRKFTKNEIFAQSFKGSLPYMSPELYDRVNYESIELTKKTDIW